MDKRQQVERLLMSYLNAQRKYEQSHFDCGYLGHLELAWRESRWVAVWYKVEPLPNFVQQVLEGVEWYNFRCQWFDKSKVRGKI